MSEQITRKIPVEGDPNARNIKEEFGTSFNELLDGIEFKPKDDEDEVIDDLVLEEKPKEEKPKEDKPNDKPNDKPKESKEPEVEKDKVRKKEELEDLSLEIDLPSLDLDTKKLKKLKKLLILKMKTTILAPMMKTQRMSWKNCAKILILMYESKRTLTDYWARFKTSTSS